MEFLKQFSDYVHGMKIDDRDLHFLIAQTLKGPAAEWWEFQSLNQTILKDFKELFKNRF